MGKTVYRLAKPQEKKKSIVPSHQLPPSFMSHSWIHQLLNIAYVETLETNWYFYQRQKKLINAITFYFLLLLCVSSVMSSQFLTTSCVCLVSNCWSPCLSLLWSGICGAYHIACLPLCILSALFPSVETWKWFFPSSSALRPSPFYFHGMTFKMLRCWAGFCLFIYCFIGC